jgi:hypothetical protein
MTNNPREAIVNSLRSKVYVVENNNRFEKWKLVK